MIIDEDPTSLFFAAKLLETCHYKVESFENPVDALHVLCERQEEYDLVIMDLDCINMHGFDLLDTIARKMNIPVTTTCYDDSEKIRKQALFSGACCHIAKPITVNKLEFVWMKEWRFSVKRNESKKQQNGKRRVDCTNNTTMSTDDLDSNKNSKTRLHWDEKLHVRFLVAVSLLGVEANSKSIMGIMNVEGLTGKEVSSHLQKHKLRLQKEKESNFSPPILPLHRFPTSMKLSFSMPNWESNPMVTEDKEDWTMDGLVVGVNEAPEAAQHDHQMLDSSNGLDINFDFLSEFLDFDFESNNFVGESEAVQHDRQMVHSLKGSKIDLDNGFLNFASESNKFMDEGEGAQHNQQMLDSSNGFDVGFDFDFDFENNHFMDEFEAASQGINEAPEIAQHDHQMVDSSNGVDINAEFLFEFLDLNFETNNVLGESEAVQHDRQMIHSLTGSEIDFDFDPEFLNFNLETNKFMDECEAAQHDQQMLGSSSDFDFESNHFMDESKAASQGRDEASAHASTQGSAHFTAPDSQQLERPKSLYYF